MNLLLTALAANVAAVYFTIAVLIVPRIAIGNVARRFDTAFRLGAFAFFVGCGLSHLHLAVHALDDEAVAPFHQIWMHVLQVIGGWAFVVAALSVLDIRIENRNPRFAQLRDMTLRDPLTGCFNRRMLDRWTRDGDRPSMAVVAIDVDDFKQVNDRCGHDVGDEVLRQLAGVLLGAIRSDDAVVRTGGDEFVLLLPGAGREAARAMVERLRTALDAAEFPSGAAVRVSAGAACSPDDAADLATLLTLADRAMYAEKRSRRSAVPAPSGEHRCPAADRPAVPVAVTGSSIRG